MKYSDCPRILYIDKMKKYKACLIQHLVDYKRTRIGIRKVGIWKQNGKKYPHILPEELKKLNIIEPIRSEFWAYKKSRLRLRINPDFHHLNSSQAMCFNLFFPILGLHDNEPDTLLTTMGLPLNKIVNWEFEYVADRKEETNFDFFIEFSNGIRLFFEVKLSEDTFGTAKKNQRRKEKLRTIYAPRLRNKVNPDCLKEEYFFKHYQILRNLSYADSKNGTFVFFVVPRQNEALRLQLCQIYDMMGADIKKAVTIVWLEDLVDKLRDRLNGKVLAVYYDMFREKYIIG